MIDDIRIGAFGKMPFHEELIRVGESVPELAEFDIWLHEGLYRSQRGSQAEWNASFDALPLVRFVFHSQMTGSDLVGVIKASRDSSGRRFPFIVAVRIDHVLAKCAFERLPLALGSFLGAAEHLLSNTGSNVNVAEFKARVEGLRFVMDLSTTRKQWNGYFAETSPGKLFETSLPRGDVSRRSILLDEYRDLLQRDFPPRLVFHLPTTGDSCEVGFWTALGKLWAPGGALPTMVLWAPNDRVRLLFAPLEPRYYDALHWPMRGGEYAHDLAHDFGAQRVHVAMAQRRFAAMLEGSGNLGELMKRIRADSGG